MTTQTERTDAVMRITEFLLARIAEEEEWMRSWPTDGKLGSWQDAVPPPRDRILGDLVAKRKIVESAEEIARAVGDSDFPDPPQHVIGVRDGLVSAVAILIATYVDHPEFQRTWLP